MTRDWHDASEVGSWRPAPPSGEPSRQRPQPRARARTRNGRTRFPAEHIAPAPPGGGWPSSSRQRRRERHIDIWRGIGLIVIVAAVAATSLLVWRLANRAAGDERGAAGAQAGGESAAYAIETAADPTPFLASHRSLSIHLPVPPETVTQVGFHQAATQSALPMSSLIPDADMKAAGKTRTMRRRLLTAAPETAEVAAEAHIPTVFDGEALRMWRSNRKGRPDTAVDVGAGPGTQVFSPVTGRIIAVRKYWLYGKHLDYEIHIQPQGWPQVDCVLIHVTDVSVRAGDQVVGGVTPIAKVRLLSDRVIPQLGQYTKDGGDHVHMQLNRVAVPGKIERVGGS